MMAVTKNVVNCGTKKWLNALKQTCKCWSKFRPQADRNAVSGPLKCFALMNAYRDKE